jgi:F-type H+-transporting ATPase subunit b
MKTLFGIFIALVAINSNLLAAEAGMPQLDPKYWASQTFWLILTFSILYLLISNFFLPKIKSNLENRENKIKDDLEEANNLKEIAEKKQNEYINIIEEAKKNVLKIRLEAKNKLDADIQNKKKAIEKDIENEIEKAQKEIIDLKKNSLNNINKISEEMTSKIIEEISGDKLNESSIKAAVYEVSKINLEKLS